MASVVTQQTMNLLPEYQERFFKDLLANVYRTEQKEKIDPATGEVMLDEAGQPIMESYAAGIAAVNPLLGTPQFDAEGKPVYQRDEAGNLVLDASGQAIQEVVGGVPRPDVMPLTPAQQQAISLGISGIGAYAPMMEEAKGTYAAGIGAVEGALGRYDPRGQLVQIT